ncbi:carboxypeptidase-like regulatory domain-containing protein [Hymenobacter latericus]|uniref:carboxypeptidase-like regulatory domain-containing protein n=1 Tax=Hymenobacter sp. YIM 151858-1 TaxID=2987688 RepID=UPI00222734E3|nr:carboxypeptidase-like regulatory domain-containing protein [Hymenobacter sp. YIM 151858-1]UYZ60324.1 carboxypeptidase-like regulatory domain-containing protein [Hymenobacter sp. YIM 151858-1]
MIIAWLKPSSLLYALLSCAHVSPQQPQPQVLDARTGAAVPFASVGVKLKPLGTVADAEGQFSLRALAAALPSDTVVVTCVGYAPRKLLLSQLQQQATVRLTPLTHELSTVTVRGSGWKRRRIGHDGSFSITYYNFHINGDTDPARKLGREVGAVLRIRPLSEIEDVHFYIGENTFRSVRLRLNVRSLDADDNPAASLLTQDVHYVLPDNAKGWQHLDLRPYHIATGNHNRVAVTLEWLEGSPDPQRPWQSLLMPAPLGPLHRMVYRDKSADKWHSLRASLSLYVTAASPAE